MPRHNISGFGYIQSTRKLHLTNNLARQVNALSPDVTDTLYPRRLILGGHTKAPDQALVAPSRHHPISYKRYDVHQYLRTLSTLYLGLPILVAPTCGRLSLAVAFDEAQAEYHSQLVISALPTPWFISPALGILMALALTATCCSLCSFCTEELLIH